MGNCLKLFQDIKVKLPILQQIISLPNKVPMKKLNQSLNSMWSSLKFKVPKMVPLSFQLISILNKKIFIKER